jgi:hypothetical protein
MLFGEVVVWACRKSLTFMMMGLADHFAKGGLNLAKWSGLAKWSPKEFLEFSGFISSFLMRIWSFTG